MFCSNCGGAVNKELSYCKHCGKKLSGAGTLSEASFNTLIGSIVGIAIAGIGLIIGLISVMKKEMGFSNEVIIAFAAAAFIIMLAAEGVFIWLLVKHTRKGDQPKVEETFETNRLNQVEIKGLSEGNFEPIPTVTEDTTRNLEPVLRETGK